MYNWETIGISLGNCRNIIGKPQAYSYFGYSSQTGINWETIGLGI